MKLNNFQKFILIAVGFMMLAMLWKSSQPKLKENNKYQCAVIGKMEDCKTPLLEQDRLK